MRGVVTEPEGLRYEDDFLDRDEEESLNAFLSSLTLPPVTIRGTPRGAPPVILDFALTTARVCSNPPNRFLANSNARSCAPNSSQDPPGAIDKALVNR